MSATRLAYRYAKSLIDLSMEKGKLNEVNDDIGLLDSMIKSSPEFAGMLKSPIIKGDKKKSILDALLKDKTSVITSAFINLMVDKKRESYLKDVAIAFKEQYNKENKITPVTITSAEELTNESIDAIKNKLVAETSIENIELTTEIDASLIGGFVLQYEDKLVDASIAHELNKYKKEFKDNEYVKKLR